MTARGKPRPFFVTEDSSIVEARAGMARRAADLAAFGQFADPADVDIANRDHDAEVARLGQYVGLRKGEAEKAIYGYQALRRLPRLRALQEDTARLDIDRLEAVAKCIGALGNAATPEAFDAFDEALIDLFTPTRRRQPLPTRNAISCRLNKMIGDFDTSAAFDPDKRRRRKKNPPGTTCIDFGPGASGSDEAWMSLTAVNASIAAIRANIDAAARKYKLTQADAAVKLLSGEISPVTGVKLHAYVPKSPDGTIDESASAFIPGFGFTGAAGTAMLHHLAAKYGSTVVDMEAAALKTVAGHEAPADVVSYVWGRDGHCVFPGCERPATSCQLDHRIPFDEGGLTNAENLYCLCQRHHNTKTDRRAFYVPDPVTGTIVWLFDNGTYQLVDPVGVIGSYVTPTNPKWKRTLDDVERLKNKTNNFYAKCHAVLDAYEEHIAPFDPYIGAEREASWNTYVRCLEDLEKLEAEFDLKFPYDPVPPTYVPDDELFAPEQDYLFEENLAVVPMT